MIAFQAAIVLAGAHASAQAQDGAGAEATIARCQALPSEAERFDCMADALRGLAEAAPPSPAAAAPPHEAASSAQGAASPALPLTTDSDPVDAAPEAGELGADSIRRTARGARAEPQRVRAAVVAIEHVGRGLLQVELENGQVWRQLASETRWDPLRFDEPDEVEIWESGFGGYRMRLVGERLVLRVERRR